ncbi:MAG: hypothetical protein ACOZNI_11070 [Myxococcota bacterium]
MLAFLFASSLAHAADGDNDEQVFNHGFRLGYSYVNTTALPSPHLFVFGYEMSQRIEGGGPIDVILVENVMLAGLNQSYAIPSMNLVTGVEIDKRVQVGVGVNLAAFDENGNLTHMIMAIGYMPKFGKITTPFHLSYIPDVDGAWRMAATTGVNW